MKHFIIDFDGTFTRVEALDELAKISVPDEEKEKVQKEISKITEQGMNGEIPFRESLTKRLKLLRAKKKHIDTLIDVLRDKITDSFARNKKFFTEYAKDVYIFSGGFKEFIIPVVKEFGIPEENVYANTFRFDGDDIVGFDEENPMSKENGKILQLKKLGLKGDIYVIGDGYTDYLMKESGLIKQFIAFTENIERQIVVDNADAVAPSFDEFLYVNHLPMAISYPKNRIRVLLLENIHQSAVDAFRKEGYQVEHMDRALSVDELIERARHVSILGIRSKTKITKAYLEKATRLMAIGTFCIGTNQVDLKACAEKGVAVFNAPYSNTRSVVELVIGEIIMLLRRAADRSRKMHQGIWDKSADNCFELRGKVLGIIGYGNIGSQLSTVAESIGLKICYYDLIDKLSLGNAEKCDTMQELLEKSDIVTLHVDGREENKGLIGKNEIAMMKQGSYLMNLSRGFVVDIDALASALKSGHLRGAAVDVFPKEPKKNGPGFESPLMGMDNVILTPHIGAGTSEAQRNIADYVPHKLMDYVNCGSTVLSVNFPEISLPEQTCYRLLHIHKNVPGILANMNSVFANHSINVEGQYLKTNENIGYVITDVSSKIDKKVIDMLRRIPNTIKFRVLY